MSSDTLKAVQDSLYAATKIIAEFKKNHNQTDWVKVLAILFNWQILLITCSFGTLFIFRKSIGNYLNSFRKAKIEGIAGVSISGERGIPDDIDSKSKLVATSNDSINIEEEILEVSTENITLEVVYISIRSGKFNEAEGKLALLNQNAKNDFEKVFNTCMFHYERFVAGHGDALSALLKIEEKLIEPDSKSIVQYILGTCYQYSKQYENAFEFYTKSTEFLNNDNRNRLNIINSAECVLKISGDNTAINFLIEKVELVKKNENKAEIFEKLGSIYSEQKHFLLAASAYLKAVDCVPNNSDYLFDVAYNLYKANYQSLSIYYYNQLLSFIPNHQGALNNMGVNFNDLKIFNESFVYFKKAAKGGNSLAASNLAASYIHNNFLEEANDIIEAAKKYKSIDDKLWTEADSLKSKMKAEKDRIKELDTQTEWHTRFFKFYAKNQFSKKEITADLSGSWILFDTPILMTWDNQVFAGTYPSHYENVFNSVEIVFSGIRGKISIKIFDAYRTLSDNYIGDAIYDHDSNTILFLCNDFGKFLSGEIKKENLVAII